MAGVKPLPEEEAARIIAAARVLFPGIPLTLGCTRPPGRYGRSIERLAVDCVIDTIAYPDEATVTHARGKGLQPVFGEECCSLVPWLQGAGKRLFGSLLTTRYPEEDGFFVEKFNY